MKEEGGLVLLMPQERLGEASRLFTVGYQGRSMDAFVRLLEDEGVERVADVRDNPWSRKPGFSKSGLRENLEEAGIGYKHLGELGLPKPVRDELREGQREGFKEAYQEHLDHHPEAIERLATLAEQAPTAVMCVERNVEDCHRRYLADRFEREGWTAIHL